MNEIIDFLRKHNEKELEYQKAICIESEFSNLDKLSEELREYYTFFVVLSAPPFMEEDRKEWYEKDAEEYLLTLKGRNIFKINKYKHKKYPELYECYLGHMDGKKMYFESFYVTKINNELKIISIYYIRNRKELEKEYREGENLGKIGKPIEITKITPPSDYAPDMKYYEAE